MPNPAPLIDAYAILGISRQASPAEIRGAHRRLVLRTHPDRNRDDIHAAALFQKVQAAYELLKDPDRRAEYDREMGRRQPSPDTVSKPVPSDSTSRPTVAEWARRTRVSQAATKRTPSSTRSKGRWADPDSATIYDALYGQQPQDTPKAESCSYVYVPTSDIDPAEQEVEPKTDAQPVQSELLRYRWGQWLLDLIPFVLRELRKRAVYLAQAHWEYATQGRYKRPRG